MLYGQSETKQNVENLYETMTPVERSIAEFFLQNTKQMDFASKNVSKQLYVSEAALSRFAKKCGYRGYREFICFYVKDLEKEQEKRGRGAKETAVMAQGVQNCYHAVIMESFRLLSERQIQNISEMLGSASRIYLYGMGSSGIAAMEFEMRLMRLGLQVRAVTDPHMMQATAALAGEQELFLAFSVSGKTREVVEALRLAKHNGGKTVLLTANQDTPARDHCDCVVQIANVRSLGGGFQISPQVALLAMTDVLYTYFLAEDSNTKMERYADTVAAIKSTTRTER